MVCPSQLSVTSTNSSSDFKPSNADNMLEWKPEKKHTTKIKKLAYNYSLMDYVYFTEQPCGSSGQILKSLFETYFSMDLVLCTYDCNFWPKISNFFFSWKFFPIFVIKILDPDRYLFSLKKNAGSGSGLNESGSETLSTITQPLSIFSKICPRSIIIIINIRTVVCKISQEFETIHYRHKHE